MELYKTLVANWITEHGCPPSISETMTLCGVSSSYASRIINGLGDDMTEIKQGIIEEIRELIGKRLSERLGDTDEKVSDSNLVALARFIMPAKQEVRQEGNVEYRLVIEVPDSDDAE